jgi:GTP cyclohydrolase III
MAMPDVYLAVDGDDVGRRLEYFLLRNDAVSLGRFTSAFGLTMRWLESEVARQGGDILFSGGDNFLARLPAASDIRSRLHELRSEFHRRTQRTLSAGIGADLREAYLALLLAKASGKDCVREYAELHEEEPSPQP